VIAECFFDGLRLLRRPPKCAEAGRFCGVGMSFEKLGLRPCIGATVFGVVAIGVLESPAQASAVEENAPLAE
jgi:hypothetical protein